MRPHLVLALAALVVSAFAAEERALFTGTDFAGWKQPHGTWQIVGGVTLLTDNSKAFATVSGTGVFLNSPDKKTSDLFTETEYGDCELHVEFCVPQGSNSGVYLMGRYELQVFDSFGKAEVKYSDCGGIYQRDGKAGEVFGGKAPTINVSKAPGEWQSFDITFRAPRFETDGRKTENARFVKVVHNGQTIHENVEVDGPTRSAAFQDEKPLGPLKLQGDHGPVAFRNLRLKAL
jgi:hypothetical protein